MENNDRVSTSPTKLRNESRSFSQLQIETMNCSHTWTIKNFSLCSQKRGEWLQSPDFSDKPDSKLKWYIQLFPNGSAAAPEGFLSLCVHLRPSNTTTLSVKFDVSLLNSEETLIKKLSVECMLDQQDYKGRGWNKLMERNSLLKEILLLDDELTIHCEVDASSESTFVPDPENPFGMNKKKLDLSKNLASMLDSGNFSDVTIKTREKTFHAHKVILAANSSEFSAILKHEWKEKGRYVVKIKDFDSESIETMLRFLYTAETPVLDFKKAKDVLVLSEKYAIDSLKSICEGYLASRLTVDTTTDLLNLAEKHSAEDLKRCSVNFIRDN